MHIIAADIGTGTQDILLYDSEQEVENSLIMVMPAPTKVTAERVRRITKVGKALVLTGTIMGGGPSAWAVRTHLKAGLPAYATEEAALTIHDNLERVKALGIR
ncbi:MAG TPA: pyruvate formate lyase-activating protein, partial [Methanosarcina sp.]|nr:pyruvate formate lyase-activating protein [Methanosarcina sp.]